MSPEDIKRLFPKASASLLAANAVPAAVAPPAPPPAEEEPSPFPKFTGMEKDLQEIIATWIEAHSAITPAPRVLRQRTDREATMTLGTPDLLVILPEGRMLWLEVKVKGGRTSKEQRELHAEIRARGHAVHVVWSLDHAISVIRAL